jgi:phosphatidylinositol alpha-1,6-mannosyltransferase
MSTPPVEIVGLLPAFHSHAVGGIQVSARDGWNGIVGRVGTGRAQAFCYEPGTSKTKTVLRALGNRRRTKMVLVWHLHLLLLLPVVDGTASRVVVFLHGIEAWRRHGPMMQFLCKRVNLFLSNSDVTWARFVECNPSFEWTPHRTVHLGIAAPLDGTTPPPSTVPSVLMVGRLDRREDYKGHRQMIDAWPRVLERMPDAELRVVGDGSLRPALEALAQRSAPGGSIRFYGRLSDSEKEQLLSECRCLAMPSRGEGFGLVYLEAMRIGRPCLVGNADAGREVVNPPEAGLAVDPDDRRVVAEAVTRLLSRGSEWDQWSARARARYEARFTAERFHRRLLAALFET